jgi:hypothetical protein
MFYAPTQVIIMLAFQVVGDINCKKNDDIYRSRNNVLLKDAESGVFH